MTPQYRPLGNKIRYGTWHVQHNHTKYDPAKMTYSFSGVPFRDKYLEQGKRYIKQDQTLYPCVSPVDLWNLPPGQEVVTVLHNQMGRTVLEFDFSFIYKYAPGMRPAEAEAMRLVSEQTSVPVPEVLSKGFNPGHEYIEMTLIPGFPLNERWDGLDEKAKESICHQTWDLISKIRDIKPPSELQGLGLFQCLADGSPSRDKLLEDLQEPARPLMSDSELRVRIYERYLHFGGRRYMDQLPDMLPRASSSVFTHADIAPGNIMIDDYNKITGILDWEWAGWYPDYWEYAQILRPVFWGDWSIWMEKTAPQKWDISGINAARGVLF
jgi:aminoglycoside phosphotransferase